MLTWIFASKRRDQRLKKKTLSEFRKKLLFMKHISTR